MGSIYRVTLVEETTDEKGGYEGTETLFELAGPAAMISKLAPGALVEALSESDASGEIRLSVTTGTEQATDIFRQDEVKSKRPRRTKAQMEADKAAAAAAVEPNAPAPQPVDAPVEQVAAPVEVPPGVDPQWNPFTAG